MRSVDTLSIKRFGTTEPAPEQRVVRAGALSATFENGLLRWIRIGDVEIIRAIAFLVRDRNWSTPASVLSNVRIVETADSFSILFDARCTSIDGDFSWHGDFKGWADGRVTCIGFGTSPTDFLTSRTGFVVLHPLAGVAGRRVVVTHVDGSVSASILPIEISPEQNYFLIRAIETAPRDDLHATLTMTGDSWEMEDQRNWSDASFKTYCRPLALPYPYVVRAGEEVRQTVSLTLAGNLPPPAGGSDVVVTVELGGALGPPPSIGLVVSPEAAEAATGKSSLVADLAPGHLNLRLDLRAEWNSALPAYRSLLQSCAARAAVEIVVPQHSALDRALAGAAARLAEAGIAADAVVVTPEADLTSYPPGKSPPDGVPTWTDMAFATRRHFPGARIGGGMLSNFAELNRKRPPRGLFDFVTHATSHIVHAADDQSVMETLESVGHMIASTRTFMGDGPYRIGPSHIGNAFNPYGSVSDNPDNRRVTVARSDPRQRGLFAAAWATGYLGQAFAHRLEAVTLGAPIGPFGVIAAPLSGPQPWYDEQAEGRVYPLFHPLRLAAHARGHASSLRTSDAARIRGFAFAQGGERTLVLANLTNLPVAVAIPELRRASIRVMDDESFGAAVADPAFFDRPGETLTGPISLAPYAVAMVRDNG